MLPANGTKTEYNDHIAFSLILFYAASSLKFIVHLFSLRFIAESLKSEAPIRNKTPYKTVPKRNNLRSIVLMNNKKKQSWHEYAYCEYRACLICDSLMPQLVIHWWACERARTVVAVVTVLCYSHRSFDRSVKPLN